MSKVVQGGVCIGDLSRQAVATENRMDTARLPGFNDTESTVRMGDGVSDPGGCDGRRSRI